MDRGSCRGLAYLLRITRLLERGNVENGGEREGRCEDECFS